MILVRLMGGLGNQMFQYAFGKYLAVKNETQLKLDLSLLKNDGRAGTVVRSYALDIFKLNPIFATPFEIKKFNGSHSSTLLERAFYKGLRIFAPVNLVVQKGNVFEEELLSVKANTCVVGRWQSYKYFEKVADHIREEFIFKDPLPKVLAPLVEKIRTSNSVSLHIRRTDYVSHSLYSNAIGSLPLLYYKKAVNKVLSELEDPNFFIFSDDIKWCRHNLNFIADPVFVEETINLDNAAEKDLHLMSLCNNHIISNSTFAWWGAWLNKSEKKMVVAPVKWANSYDYDAVDIIPFNWIKI